MYKAYATKLEKTLHDEIPISNEMGISVASYDGNKLRLAAPISPNINHKCTAFGGSLYSLAVLCGWGIVHIKLEEAGLHRHIVIQEGSIRYLLPVVHDMHAECDLDAAAWQRCLATLKKHGRSRISLDIIIKHEGKLAVEFTGRYVVHE